MFNYKEELKNFPETFGVYIMKDKFNKIIYIGKANNIKNRVLQYFNGSDKRLKIESLRSNINNIEYIITDSELEALVLESNLIKQNKPKYNTLLKDDKNYSYIEITLEEDFPRVISSKNIKNHKSLYFGPFPDKNALDNIVDILNKTYKLKICTKYSNSCFYKDIDKCCAPCKNKVTKQQYSKKIKEIIEILEGNVNNLVEKYTKEMYKCSKKLEFEKANEYKQNIEDLKYIISKQRVSSQENKEEDVLVCEVKENTAIIVLFMIRNGKVIGKEQFFMTETNEETKSALLSSFIKQYYFSNTYIPSTLILEETIEDLELIKQFFNKENKVEIIVDNKNKIINLAKQNASIILNETIIKNKNLEDNEGLKNLEKLFNKKLERIEAFDISNTNGSLNVASMVVFTNGKKDKYNYRKFKLETKGANDYDCMKEVIKRRFTDDNLQNFPNLILVDGGKGQITSAKEILKELNIDILVVGMVKDDNHNSNDLIFNDECLNINKNSKEFKLIANIQNEAHNCAIEYHRKLRDKNTIKSQLENIEGVGKEKAKELLKTFNSIDNIKKASIEELVKVKGISKIIAENIVKYFKN